MNLNQGVKNTPLYTTYPRLSTLGCFSLLNIFSFRWKRSRLHLEAVLPTTNGWKRKRLWPFNFLIISKMLFLVETVFQIKENRKSCGFFLLPAMASQKYLRLRRISIKGRSSRQVHEGCASKKIKLEVFGSIPGPRQAHKNLSIEKLPLRPL